jgi:hypothetical protein
MDLQPERQWETPFTKRKCKCVLQHCIACYMVPMLRSNTVSPFSGRTTFWRLSWASRPQCASLPLWTPQMSQIYFTVWTVARQWYSNTHNALKWFCVKFQLRDNLNSEHSRYTKKHTYELPFWALVSYNILKEIMRNAYIFQCIDLQVNNSSDHLKCWFQTNAAWFKLQNTA